MISCDFPISPFRIALAVPHMAKPHEARYGKALREKNALAKGVEVPTVFIRENPNLKWMMKIGVALF